MEKIKRFFECLIPVTTCNMKCSYCYVIQRENRKNKMAELKYPPSQIGRALTIERLGGVCYFSICGAGETTLQPEIDEIVYNILAQGHFVNITTNGTVTVQLKKIINRAKPYMDRLHFAFSFHYLELIRIKKMDCFFDNIQMVRKAGASFMVQFNMCDEYVPHLDEIERLCLENVGAKPQIAATRKEEEGLQKIELLTKYGKQEYHELGHEFDSLLFDFTIKNFNVKRNEFCYAGDWTGILDLSTGIMRRCYSSYLFQDIFKNPNRPIRFLAMGHACGSPFCMNSSHFMSLGVIPSVETPTYAQLRERDADWYGEEIHEFLSSKLSESNDEYGAKKRVESGVLGAVDSCIWSLRRCYKKIFCGGNNGFNQKDSPYGS
nr:radical SAM protein [uncultured Eisenbergiella sp.]